MTLAAYFVVHILAGWLAGKAYVSLMRARAKGKFTALEWAIFVTSMLVAMLFARFVIGGAKRMPDIPDWAVGFSAVVMLVVFVWVAGMFRSDRRL